MWRVSPFLQRGGRPLRPATRRKKRARLGSYGHRLVYETLELRTLLSASLQLPAGWQATPILDPDFVSLPGVTGSSVPSGLTPNQIRGAYGLGGYTSGVLSHGISFGGIQGDGRGQTIAIVDAYDDPTALADLNGFSTYFGLPTFDSAGGSTFEKLNQDGGTSLPGADPGGPYQLTGNLGWEIEESLDIEWAHAMAPLANIILFEANDAANGLFTAVQTAANTPGVVAVSMSWSGPEFAGESSYDSLFTTPAGHVGGSATLGGAGLAGGITFLGAAGDNGAYGSSDATLTPQYPAASPNVVAVGGTTLAVSGSDTDYTYGSETSWGNGAASGFEGGGGGGISAYESRPAYQDGVVSGTQREYPDVSADADPDTGVPIYDSWDFGVSTPWAPFYLGGTSLATPLWTGVIAVADEGRAIAGNGSLDGPSQTLPELYKLPAADFHDITIGSNGYAAGPGYDLASGIGSPAGNLLIPGLGGESSSTAPNFTLAGPTSGSFVAGQPVTIQWTDANVDAGSKISLAYDTTSTWGNPKWIEIDGVIAADGVGTYSWNTSGVAAGSYYVDGYLYDAGQAYLSHLSSSITITAAAAPSFTLTGPTSGTFTAGESVAIQWAAAHVPSGSTISLAYDTTSDWGNPTWIEIDGVSAAGADSYSWDTTNVPAGTYYIDGYMHTPSTDAAVMSNLTTPITVSGPSFTLTSPTSGAYAAGQPITVRWTAADVPGGSTISLAYGTSSKWSNLTWIEIDGVRAAGADSYSWNTAALSAGTYYIKGYMYTPSTGAAIISQPATPFTVTGSSFARSSPAVGTFTAGQAASVQATDAGVSGGSTISLTNFTSGSSSDATPVAIDEVIAIDAVNTTGGVNVAGRASDAWNTMEPAAGTYYVDDDDYAPSSDGFIYAFPTEKECGPGILGLVLPVGDR